MKLCKGHILGLSYSLPGTAAEQKAGVKKPAMMDIRFLQCMPLFYATSFMCGALVPTNVDVLYYVENWIMLSTHGRQIIDWLVHYDAKLCIF